MSRMLRDYEERPEPVPVPAPRIEAEPKWDRVRRLAFLGLCILLLWGGLAVLGIAAGRIVTEALVSPP